MVDQERRAMWSKEGGSASHSRQESTSLRSLHSRRRTPAHSSPRSTCRYQGDGHRCRHTTWDAPSAIFLVRTDRLLSTYRIGMYFEPENHTGISKNMVSSAHRDRDPDSLHRHCDAFVEGASELSPSVAIANVLHRPPIESGHLWVSERELLDLLPGMVRADCLGGIA